MRTGVAGAATAAVGLAATAAAGHWTRDTGARAAAAGAAAAAGTAATAGAACGGGTSGGTSCGGGASEQSGGTACGCGASTVPAPSVPTGRVAPDVDIHSQGAVHPVDSDTVSQEPTLNGDGMAGHGTRRAAGAVTHTADTKSVVIHDVPPLYIIRVDAETQPLYLIRTFHRYRVTRFLKIKSHI